MRGGARAEEALLIPGLARKARPKPPKAGKDHNTASVDELPPEALVDKELLIKSQGYQVKSKPSKTGKGRNAARVDEMPPEALVDHEPLIESQGHQARSKPPRAGKGRNTARVDEMPPEALVDNEPRIESQGHQARSKPPNAGKNHSTARVDEMPPEAREAIERMLKEGGCTYQRIADELEKAGFVIKASQVGRHEARKAADKRMDKLLDRQLNALNRWMEKQSGFDAAGAALALVIGKLGRRIGDGGEMFADLSADKAAAGLIQAARAAVQYEKTAGERKRLRAEARAEAVKELRESLKRSPELWERIEALVAEGG